MDKNELFKMFELDKPAGPSSGTSVVTAVDKSGVAVAKSLSGYVLELDKWSVRRGVEFLDGIHAPALRPLNLADDAESREMAAADILAVAFDADPKLNDGCHDKLRHDFLAKLVATDEYRAIHTRTNLNCALSEIAAVEFGKQLSALRIKRKAKERNRKAKPRPDKFEAEMEAMGDDVELFAAVAEAAKEADKEVEICLEMQVACGMGEGTKGEPVDPKDVNVLYQRVKNDPALRRICEMAGRYRRLAQGKQKNRVSHGYDDMVGITLGGDVGRLVGSELAMLGIDGLDDELAVRIVENRAFIRDHQSVEPVGKGPIVVTVDESGSMSGDKVNSAKALALAMAWVARSQKRWCCLIGYSGGCRETVCVLPPGRWNERALCDWLVHFAGMGSDLDIPVEVLPRIWGSLESQGMTRGKTDIVMITDAKLHLPREVEERFLKFKATEKVSMTALVIQSKPGDMVKIADDVHEVKSLNVTESAVEKVVSI